MLRFLCAKLFIDIYIIKIVVSYMSHHIAKPTVLSVLQAKTQSAVPSSGVQFAILQSSLIFQARLPNAVYS